jgi:hypothetical protein
MTKQELKNNLENVKNKSFELYVNEFINLEFWYDIEDNTINVKNTEHYASADYYLFTEENIKKVYNLYKDDCK